MQQYLRKYLIGLTGIVLLSGCTHLSAPIPETFPGGADLGKLNIGFDIDDTILYSEENFIQSKKMYNNTGEIDFGWINTHDSVYSTVIPDMAKLVHFFRAQGHTVYFITARPGNNGATLARFLTRQLGFPITVRSNLFFSPKEADLGSGIHHTVKHRLIRDLGIELFYGDSDTDIVAALVGGAKPVRVVRDPRSLKAYARGHFGDLLHPHEAGNPFTPEDYRRFILAGVGPYGETIYPIHHFDEPLVGFDSDSTGSP